MSNHRSLTGRLLTQLKTDWQAAPPVRWARLIGGLFVAFVFALAFVYGLTVLVRSWIGDGLVRWDERTLLAFNGTWNPLGFTDGIILESPANLFILIPVTLIAAALAVHRRRPALAVALIANYVLARPLIWLGWSLWDRQRPQLIKDGAAALSAHSFPSGHAILCMSGYGLLCYIALTASKSTIERIVLVTVFIVFCSLVSGSRLLLGAHWPSDVIAGAVIGLVWLIGVICAVRFAER